MSLAVITHAALEHTTIVLTKGRIGDYAAYEGPAHWSLAQIASGGTKVSRERAETLFPDHVTKTSSYRR